MPISKFPPVACLHSVLALAPTAAAPLVRAQASMQLLDQYRAQAGAPSGPSRDQGFSTSKHGREWSCASCHGNPPTQTDRHAVTGRSVALLAPVFGPEHFIDIAETEKWFRRNCNDVVEHGCAVVEKADVLNWLMTLEKQDHPTAHSIPDLMRSLQMSGRFAVTIRAACTCLTVAGLGLSFLVATKEGPSMRAVPLLPKYRQECASCYIVYPPKVLPASFWQRTLGNLQYRYGTDISLDPATIKQLDQWLTANTAGCSKSMSPPPEDRITRSAWFARTHNETSTAMQHRSAIRSAPNCAACHIRTGRGDFDEHNVRTPR